MGAIFFIYGCIIDKVVNEGGFKKEAAEKAYNSCYYRVKENYDKEDRRLKKRQRAIERGELG